MTTLLARTDGCSSRASLPSIFPALIDKQSNGFPFSSKDRSTDCTVQTLDEFVDQRQRTIQIELEIFANLFQSVRLVICRGWGKRSAFHCSDEKTTISPVIWTMFFLTNGSTRWVGEFILSQIRSLLSSSSSSTGSMDRRTEREKMTRVTFFSRDLATVNREVSDLQALPWLNSSVISISLDESFVRSRWPMIVH